ncbi:MAG: PKD domain containing protein [Candidatus Nanosalina sp. J07AB43]|nr:MAG: PKD domain containing protein [Candidatus Nanosalina sp. J07AB43]
MDLISGARKKLTGVTTENEIQPRPSIVLTTVIDNPRFEQANIDTSGTVPTIDGTFAIDVTNTGLLPTRSTRITGAKVELIKDQSSLTVGTIEEPQSIGSISGGSTETINIKFERDGDFLRNVVQEVCQDGKVRAKINFTMSEILLAATYSNELEVPVNRSDCKTLTVNVSGQSEVNINEEYRWEISTVGEGSIGSVSWDMGDGSTYTGRAVTHSYNQTGDYTITVDTERGYSASKEIDVSLVPFGLVGPVELNVGNEATWNATGENLSQVSNITWNFGDGESRTTQSNSVSYAYDEEGNYTLTAVSDTGYDDNLEVQVSFPNVIVDRISSPDSVSNQQDFNASVQGSNLSEASTLRWDMGDGITLNGREVTHRYATSGEYEIIVEAIISGEVVSSASKSITAEQFVL